MRETSLARLDSLAALVNEKVTTAKDPNKPYVGLEHLPSGGSLLLGTAESGQSISTNNAFRAGDVLFGKLRPRLRKSIRAPFAGYCSTDILVLRPAPDVDPVFAGFVLQSDAVFSEAVRTEEGTKMPRSSWGALRHLMVYCPKPSQQQRIAQILSTVDEAIVQTEALIAKTQQIKAGLMHDLFTRGVTADGQLRPARDDAPQVYKESPLGRIPKEWGCETLESLLALVACPMRSGPFGSALLKDELVENGIPLLGIDNVYTETFVAEYRRFVTPHKFVELSRYAVLPGDVIITIMGTVGRSCVVPEDIGRALSSKHLWTMTFDRKKLLPELACWQLNHAPWVKTWFARQSQGAVMDAIQSSTLRTLRLPVPPPSEQLLLRDRYAAIQGRLAEENEALRKLEKVKRGLMQDLLTGRVPVGVEITSNAGEVAANA
jgi:type I restriction enzyme, S subunit